MTDKIESPSGNAPQIAVVGCGYWGKNLVRNFHRLGALAAVCDRDPERRAAMLAEHGVAARDFDALLADPMIDGIAVASPAASHASVVRAALEAGKHVFCEKPLALDLADAEQLCEIAERNDQRLMVGHLLQYHPAFIALRAMVREGRLGRLQYIYSNRLNLGKIRREEDILWSFAPHDVSMILSLVGGAPDRVTALGAYHLHKSIADVTTTHMSFPGGEQAHIFVSWLHPFKEQKLVVIGDRAMAVFDDGEPWESKLLFYPHRIEWRGAIPVPEKAEAEPVTVAPAEPLRRECQHFLDCIESGATPRTDGREGIRVLDVLRRAADAIVAERGRRTTTATATEAHPGVTIHESACVDDAVEIGRGTRIWHFSHILPRSRVGRDVIVGQNVMIGPDATVGDGCKIQNNVSVYKGVTLEDEVFCGPSCVFTNVINPRAGIERKDEFRPTHVGRGATIGANATILCGVRIGAYALIAAGAVVTHDVPDFALVGGVPARPMGWVSHDGERLEGARSGDDLVCPRSGRRYREVTADKLEEITDVPTAAASAAQA